MNIRPIKLIKSISQSSVQSDDLMERPRMPLVPGETQKHSNVAFAGQKLIFGGKDVSQLITESLHTNPQFLSSIAKELEEYKKKQLRRAREAQAKGTLKGRAVDEVSHILALCDAFIAKIAELLKNRYEQTQSGLHCHFDEDGQLILNGMNVNGYIESCRDNPTPKSRLFLKGIRGRLILILQSKSNSRDFERLQETILALFEDIDGIMSHACPAS